MINAMNIQYFEPHCVVMQVIELSSCLGTSKV